MTGTMRMRKYKIWENTVDIGKDANGKRRRRSRTVHGTKTEAERELRVMIAEAEAARSRQASPLMRDWLREYHAQVVSRKCRIKTIERYDAIIEQKLIPLIGDVELGRLTPLQIEAAYDSLMAPKDGKKGHSARTVRLYHSVLSGACKYAMRRGLIDRSPTPLVNLPPVYKKEVKPPEVEAVKALLRLVASEGHRLFEFIHLLVYTGMRKGEAWGLRWRNVDLEEGSIYVNEAAVRSHKHGTVEYRPKTEKGVRTISLDDLTVTILRHFREEQIQQGRGRPDDLVFPGPDGKHLPETTMMTHLKQLGAQVELPEINFHAFRHFHASVALQDERYLMVVSRRLGHSSISVTVDTYGHLMKGSQKPVVEAFALAMADDD